MTDAAPRLRTADFNGMSGRSFNGENEDDGLSDF
jgi:hypothetical protein